MTKITLPKNPADAADAYFRAKEARLAVDKLAAAAKAEEVALWNYLLELLPSKGLAGVTGKVARVELNEKSVPRATDWAAFWKGFDKKKDFDLLQKRLSEAAVQARWEAGKVVPGVIAEKVTTLSVHKV